MAESKIIDELKPRSHINNISYPFVCRCDIGDDKKRCGNCKHDEESPTDEDSYCYMCQRNNYDNRIDKWESK